MCECWPNRCLSLSSQVALRICRHHMIRSVNSTLPFFFPSPLHTAAFAVCACVSTAFGSKRLLVSQHVWFVMKHTASQRRLATKEKGNRWSRYVQSLWSGGHSHTAVRFLLKALVGRHAQRHLAHLAAETTFVPVLQRGERESTSTTLTSSHWNKNILLSNKTWNLYSLPTLYHQLVKKKRKEKKEKAATEWEHSSRESAAVSASRLCREQLPVRDGFGSNSTTWVENGLSPCWRKSQLWDPKVIDLKGQHFHHRCAVELVRPLQTGCALMFLA